MKTNPAFRTFASLVCAVSAAAAFWAGIYTLRYWDDVWTEPNYFKSSYYRSTWYDMEDRVRETLELVQAEGGLTYIQQERLSALRTALDPANTNYRYELRLDDTGELVMSNLSNALLDDVATGIQLGTFSFRTEGELHDRDKVYWTDSNDEGAGEYEYNDGYHGPAHILEVWTGTGYLSFSSAEEPLGYFNEYGWCNDGGWYSYNSEYDSRVVRTSYALRAGVLSGLPVDDDFHVGRINYNRWNQNLPAIGIAALASMVLFLVTLVYLLCAAGHRKDEEGISLGWLERVPLDVYAVAAFFMAVFGIAMSDSIYYGLNMEIRTFRIAGLLGVSTVVAAVVLSFLLTAVTRAKAHVFWQSMICWRVCVWCWNMLGKGACAAVRGIRGAFRMLAMNVRLGLVFLVYLAMNAFLAAGFYLSYESGFFFIGLVLFNGGVFWLGCRWIEQWRTIRMDTGRVLEGDTAVQIDTKKMYPDLKQHAEQLNDLGASINRAVDERLKSEHFKAELITNVSHDLKTPLTSIINYVDLLKKTDIRDPKALEYLEVLDRKSQRLKKLTEDLVEASKASTGNVTVNPSRMDLVEFTQQAAAEYQDRLTHQRLTLITKMADHPVYISADGRHMWRILDNLLGNCVKYAMEGTRIYLDVVEWDGKGCISVKNISREALNVDPQELTERFVRGDESRTTEGSGLGLSIARSLTEVQGGTFRLYTDGDLFKVTVYFPVVLALEESNLGEKA